MEDLILSGENYEFEEDGVHIHTDPSVYQQELDDKIFEVQAL